MRERGSAALSAKALLQEYVSCWGYDGPGWRECGTSKITRSGHQSLDQQIASLTQGYLPAVASCDDIFVKVVFSWEPSEFTTVMIATEIPAAIKPYSMAVAPDSSRRNCLRMRTDLNPRFGAFK
jgi:hypothetical protein